jgi:hypothetical protein
MKISNSLLILGLAGLSVASSWFSKAAYNKWHQTELERWLSDHDIPYATPADRKDLEEIVKKNWDSKVSTPYTDWDVKRLQQYLADRGYQAAEGADQSKNGLIASVKSYWHETEDQAQEAYASVRNWIFDSWSDSQLKAFLDRHGIPAPQPHKRDNLLAAARNNYDSAAKKAGETAAYPGNWLYETWSESDLKAWLDERGIPVPQPTSRDRLIASVRRNARLASKKGHAAAASVSSAGKAGASSASSAGDAAASSASSAGSRGTGIVHGAASSGSSAVKAGTDAVKGAAASGTSVVKDAAASGSSAVKGAASSASSAAGSAKDTVNDAVFDTWSDSRIKEWADRNGIKVPQGSKRNELLALARKHRASLSDQDLSGSAASAYGAATSKVGNTAAKATDDVKLKAEDLFNQAIGTWSETRLKAFLDARGIPVPQSGKRDELIAAVRRNRHKASNGYGSWSFDTWSLENLRSWLSTNGDKAAKKAAAKSGATREELAKQAQEAYASASKSGGSGFASVTSALAAATDYAKDTTFDTWTSSDLKAYLDSYGVPVPQGTKEEELRAMARKQSTYFRYGTSSPGGTILAKLQNGAQWVLEQLKFGAASGRKEGEKAYDYAKEQGTKATHRAGEAAQQAKDRAKEEL